MLKSIPSTEQSSKSHSRSDILSNLQSPTGDQNTLPSSTQWNNGLHYGFMAPTRPKVDPLQHYNPFPVDSLAEPTKSHQISHSEQIREKIELPLVIVQSCQPSFQPGPPKVKSSTHRSESRSSLEQSWKGTPSRQRGTSLTGSSSIYGKSDEKIGKFVDWFRGESAPISIGILPSPTKEKVSPLGSIASSSEMKQSNLSQRTSIAQGASKPAMASRFSFFSSKASLPKPDLLPLNAGDELLDMEVSHALFPAGLPDPTCPAAFKNLQQQAENLLTRLQAAYRERTLQLREMAAEKEALAEETEGAETRARHLKLQLDDTSVKLAEQDEAMMNLVDDLAQEKLARREEEEARKRTIRLVKHNSPRDFSHRRISCANTVSDSGFESEDDSPATSFISRQNGAHSPTMSMSSVSSTNPPEGYPLNDALIPTSASHAARLRMTTSQLASKGIPAAYRPDLHDEPTQSACPNCQGVRASEAWSVLGVLKEENHCLKNRIGELEGAVDGCLDVISNSG